MPPSPKIDRLRPSGLSRDVDGVLDGPEDDEGSELAAEWNERSVEPSLLEGVAPPRSSRAA